MSSGRHSGFDETERNARPGRQSVGRDRLRRRSSTTVYSAKPIRAGSPPSTRVGTIRTAYGLRSSSNPGRSYAMACRTKRPSKCVGHEARRLLSPWRVWGLELQMQATVLVTITTLSAAMRHDLITRHRLALCDAGDELTGADTITQIEKPRSKSRRLPSSCHRRPPIFAIPRGGPQPLGARKR